MGKISPVSAKYIVHAQIAIEGVVDKPDVIGSIFGQTEGLLGSDLELRELQRSGRIGRIEVDAQTKTGKTTGVITIPTSLDKTETVLIAAALETIERIGPCIAKVKVTSIEDVRISKRNLIVDRAKNLLQDLTHSVLPDSRDIKELVESAVKIGEVMEYGKDRLPAGPGIDDADEIIVVEGRADVLNLLRNEFKNCIAMNGTSVPQTIIDLSKSKTITVFVDGDRGGDLIVKELTQVADIDFVAKAPDGKEVEELAKKEIHKALRGKIVVEQAKLDINHTESQQEQEPPKPQFQPREQQRPTFNRDNRNNQDRDRNQRFNRSSSDNDFRRPQFQRPQRRPSLTSEQRSNIKNMLDDLVGTRGAYLLDDKANILGKVPTSELPATISSIGRGIDTIILDGHITQELLEVADRAAVKHLVAAESEVTTNNSRVNIITEKELAATA